VDLLRGEVKQNNTKKSRQKPKKKVEQKWCRTNGLLTRKWRAEKEKSKDSNVEESGENGKKRANGPAEN